MDGNKRFVTDARIGRTIEALAKNRIPAVYAPTKEEAVQLVKSLMNRGDTISCGGSVTLAESGVRELMQSGEYTFLDREAMPPEEAYLKTFSADVFLTSANAITEDGELYNVDGNGNRVAALIYGPKKVIVVTFSLGISKLTTLFPVPQPPSIRALAKNTAYSPTILLPIPYPLFESVKPANDLCPTLSTYILA